MNKHYKWAIFWVVWGFLSYLGNMVSESPVDGEYLAYQLLIFGPLVLLQIFRGRKVDEKKEKEEQDQIDSDIRNKQIEEKKRQEEKQEEKNRKLAEVKEKKELKVAKKEISSDLDKRGTGIVDEIEDLPNDEFKKLLSKYEKEIAEIDRKHIKDFVKLSSYINTKRKNIQHIFDSIQYTEDKKEFNNHVGILKNEIYSYKLIIYNALNMITALVEDKQIIFFEIYDSFDKLKVFNSNYENEVSNKLSNIGDGLSDLMYSIHQMGADVVSEIGNLTYVTEESSRMLSEKLKEVDSSVQENNLLAGIQTYQLYKLNKSNRNRLK
tara:strand:- start:45 stop:1010 length:966 start_codon:yes stop_codon:yes gene_type:complete